MQSQLVKHVEGFFNCNAESAEHDLLTYLEVNKEGTTAFKCFDNSIQLDSQRKALQADALSRFMNARQKNPQEATHHDLHNVTKLANHLGQTDCQMYQNTISKYELIILFFKYSVVKKKDNSKVVKEYQEILVEQVKENPCFFKFEALY